MFFKKKRKIGYGYETFSEFKEREKREFEQKPKKYPNAVSEAKCEWRLSHDPILTEEGKFYRVSTYYIENVWENKNRDNDITEEVILFLSMNVKFHIHPFKADIFYKLMTGYLKTEEFFKTKEECLEFCESENENLRVITLDYDCPIRIINDV